MKMKTDNEKTNTVTVRYGYGTVRYDKIKSNTMTTTTITTTDDDDDDEDDDDDNDEDDNNNVKRKKRRTFNSRKNMSHSY
jgi:hypothetical protein